MFLLYFLQERTHARSAGGGRWTTLFGSKDTWTGPFKTALGRCIEQQEAGTTLLSRTLPHQAALYGVLLQLIQLGLVRLSLETSKAEGA